MFLFQGCTIFSKINNSSFEILFPNLVSFLQLAFFSLFSLVSIFRVRGLLQISKNPLLPVEGGGRLAKSQLEAPNF